MKKIFIVAYTTEGGTGWGKKVHTIECSSIKNAKTIHNAIKAEGYEMYYDEPLLTLGKKNAVVYNPEKFNY